LQSIFIAFKNSEHCVLTNNPGFFFFMRSARVLDQKIIGVPQNENFISEIEKHQPSLIIIDNPNNPLGTILDEDTLEKIIQAAPGYVLIDEAYFPYGRITMMPYLSKYPNLIIVRSLSKTGFAGMRFGFLCCHPDLAASIKKVALPFNINVYTASVMNTVLDHFDILKEQTQQIIKDREDLYKNMKEIVGEHVTPTHTNFINFSIPGYEASDAFNYFLKNNILLFHYRMKSPHPLANHLRVSIGTPAENKKFLEVLRNLSA
jgi:histidinol-phosphate aminotransferase